MTLETALVGASTMRSPPSSRWRSHAATRGARPAQSMNSVSLRSTRITRPGSAIPASSSDSRGAVARSSSPTTTTTARPLCTVVFKSKGVGNFKAIPPGYLDNFQFTTALYATVQSSPASDEPVEHLSEDPIAPTRCALEPAAIRDGDPSPVEADEAGLLEDAGHHRHRGASDPEHLGQELLGEGELVR